LHGISSIIDEKKEVAQDMIADISLVLRKTLQIDYGQKIPLKDELEILNTYLSIETKRFEHQLSITKSIDKASLDILILPFMLQPMVENAIKHGFISHVNKLEILINIHLSNSKLSIEIANNGKELLNIGHGTGLSNLRERLINTYNDTFKMTLIQNNDWVTNLIEIKI